MNNTTGEPIIPNTSLKLTIKLDLAETSLNLWIKNKCSS